MSDTGNLGMGLMLRVVDVKLALEAFPVATQGRGEIVLEVEDDVIPQNARTWRMSAREGRLRLRPESGRGGSPRLPRLSVGADLLGPMLAGTIAPTRAAEVGLVSSAGGAAEIVEPWFRARPVFLHHFNAF
jgi:hypothetical protein